MTSAGILPLEPVNVRGLDSGVRRPQVFHAKNKVSRFSRVSDGFGADLSVNLNILRTVPFSRRSPGHAGTIEQTANARRVTSAAAPLSATADKDFQQAVMARNGSLPRFGMSTCLEPQVC